MNSEDKRILEPIAKAEAQDYLRQELDRVNKKIGQQEDYLERYFAEDEDKPKGSLELLRIYHLEKDLIEALMDECRQNFLLDVFHRRLKVNERQLAASRGITIHAIKEDSQFWQLRREAEILKEMLGRWTQHLRMVASQRGKA